MRSQYKRPARGRIAKYVASNYDLDQNRRMEITDKLFTDSVVYDKVNNKVKNHFKCRKVMLNV